MHQALRARARARWPCKSQKSDGFCIRLMHHVPRARVRRYRVSGKGQGSAKFFDYEMCLALVDV